MALAKDHRHLMMRANRLLGPVLVERDLISLQDLERATERLLELTARGEPRECTLLGVLAHELKVVAEADVLRKSVEADGIGLADLRAVEVPEELRREFDPGECWATWTVPFDREDDFYSVATAYYLSAAVRKHWEKVLNGPIIWYATTLEMLADYLEKLEQERAAMSARSSG